MDKLSTRIQYLLVITMEDKKSLQSREQYYEKRLITVQSTNMYKKRN